MRGPFEVVSVHSSARGDGVAIAWLESVMRSALDPANGLFTPSADETAVIPAPMSQMREFGRLVGMAIGRGLTPGIPLTSGCVYWFTEHLQSVAGDSDLFDLTILGAWGREEDSEYVTNLLKVRDDSVVFDAMVGTDFPSPSDDRTLNTENVDLYVKAALWHRFVEPHSVSCRWLLAGMNDILPGGMFEWFTVPELRTMISGPSVVDRDDLRRSATFLNALNEGEPAVEWDWFWEIVMADDFDADHVGSLLEFVSGSRKPPIGGFSGHSRAEKWLQVVLDASPELRNTHPRSQTCFKQLRIHRYDTREIMKERLISAIRDGNSLELA